MPRYALTLEYEGTAYAGYQVQPGQPTVQAELQRAFQAITGKSADIRVSGRTDAGVHAEGQVIAVTLDRGWHPAKLRDALNANLPRDVAIVDGRLVPPEFDPRRWAWGKHYRYRWLVRPSRSPTRDAFVWHRRSPLDVSGMRLAAERLVGRHDFSSFRASGCVAASPVRMVKGLELREQGDELHLHAHGQGFLRHMVRIIAGTIYEVGVGRREPGWVDEVLEARRRDTAGRTAPARGLCLVAVDYRDGPPPWIEPSTA